MRFGPYNLDPLKETTQYISGDGTITTSGIKVGTNSASAMFHGIFVDIEVDRDCTSSELLGALEMKMLERLAQLQEEFAKSVSLRLKSCELDKCPNCLVCNGQFRSL